MSKLVIANWKTNPGSEAEANKIAESIIKNAAPNIQTVIAPSFAHLSVVSKIERPRYVSLGSQNLFWESSGAFTGEVGIKQLLDLEVKYAIIGHSERRINLGETDEMVSKKIKAAIQNKITPILCVGETEEEKKGGLKEKVVIRELKIGLSLLEDAQDLVIAYEPIWAIGTGISDAPEDTILTFRLIRQTILELGLNHNIKLIYGGSVSSKNIENFIQHAEIEGVLVGKASLSGEEFKKIMETSSRYK